VLIKYYIKSEPIKPTRRLSSSNVNRVFDKYSKGSGSLDVTKLKDAINELLGYKLTIVESKRYIDQYDTKKDNIGDGKIDNIEFNKIIAEIQHDNSSTQVLSATVFFICFIIITATTYS
jgi:Ca2+-binding EF-hand superfamily protein